MRFLPILGYAALAIGLFVRNGVPLSDDRILAWLVLGLLCVSLAAGNRRWRGLLRDWLPLAVALTLYDVLRGVGGGRVPIHHEEPIWLAQHLFGVVPSVWLQQHLWDAAHIHWYDYAAWLVYTSYYFATFVVLAALWLVRPQLFRRYAALTVGLWLGAVACFTLAPTYPPWLASQQGLIGPVTRIVGPIGTHFPGFDPSSLWEHGVRLTNDLAAFPSLHEAMTLLIAVFFWSHTRRWWLRVPLVLYPLAMAFALVYTGEHYVSDLLGAVLLVAGVVTVERYVAQLRSERGARLADRLGAGRARPVGADDQSAIRARAAHDRVRP